MIGKVRQIYFSLLLLPITAAPALTQPKTPTEEIEQIRRDKMTRLWPERQSPLVDEVNVERGLLSGTESGKGANGWQIVMGGMRSGQGVSFGVGYRRSELSRDRLDWRVTGHITPRLATMADFQLDFKSFRTDRTFLNFYGKYENSPQMDYYGQGTSTSVDDRTSYRYETTQFDSNAGFEIFKNFRAGITSGVLGVHSDLQAEDSETERTSSLSRGKWLGDRGPSDPRPYGETVISGDLVDRSYFEWKNRLWTEDGISFGGYFSANTQWGSEGGSSHSISETLLLFTWEPVRDADSAGRLVVGLAHDWTLGRPTTREFADNQGVVETPNDLDTDPDLTFTTLGLLHWEHEQHTGPDRGWGIRAGQLYAPSYFGPARYLDDDRRFFMARPLAAAGGAQWVGNNDIGLGVNGIVWKGPLYASAAIMDGKANRRYPDFGSLVDGKFLYLGEIGFERDVDGPNEAAVRLTISHLDLDDGEGPEHGPGQSVMVSGDRQFNGRWALAGRWSRSFERLSGDYRELFSVGALWLVPFARSQDIAGFGIFAGKPSDADRGVESGCEVFYVLRLTQTVSVMPDLQYWWRNDEDVPGARTWVLGLRAEFEF